MDRGRASLWKMGIAGIGALLLAAGIAAGMGEAPPAAGSAPLGTVHFPTSAGPAAETAFLRGVAALHSFWYEEAAEAFKEAERLEPGFALAYWGEAMTYNHPLWAEQDRDAARAALARLAPTPEARAAKAPTARERSYLEAVEVLYAEVGDKPARDEAYEKAMARLAAANPDDDEAAAFHALALLGTVRPGESNESQLRKRMAAAGTLEELFARHPNHPGVVHYLIHAYDDPIHAPLGLRAARVYARVAPAAPHALHMPAHIFVQLGKWDDAAASNEAAWAASAAWVQRKSLPGEKRDFHSLSWLQYVYLQQGRWAKAAETLETAWRAIRESPESSRVAGALAGMEARQAIETGRSMPALPAMQAAGTAHSGKEMGYRHDQGSTLLAEGLAAARAGDKKGAEAAARELRDMAEHHEGYAAKPFLVMAGEIEGASLLSAKKEEGLALLAKAAKLESELDSPSGPPEPAKPACELYGEALLAQGRAEEAARQFEISLARTPNRAASLLGAVRTAARRGDREGLLRDSAALAAIWRQADPDLPQLAELRRLEPPAR